jgi:hypothetical protein
MMIFTAGKKDYNQPVEITAFKILDKRKTDGRKFN